MKRSVDLPDGGSMTIDDELLDPHREFLSGREGSPVRLAYGAAHVVMKEAYREVDHGPERPGTSSEISAFIDWETTMALRRRRYRCGIELAEAMDTAQRFEIGWEVARELIRRSAREEERATWIAGAGVDHLQELRRVDDWLSAMQFQVELIQGEGGMPILLPSVWLASQALSEEFWVELYQELLSRLKGPVFLHWLGEAFAPALLGQFPGSSFSRILALRPEVLRGAKISLLDAAREKQLRDECLPREQIILTGDDFHFGDLILGEDGPSARSTRIGDRDVPLGRFSHALLGIFDGTVEPVSLALRALAVGDRPRAKALLEPCERLGRAVFQSPTHFYKAGLAFLSWLDGEQENFMLVNHQERLRPRSYYGEVASLAARAGVFRDAELTSHRLREYFATD